MIRRVGRVGRANLIARKKIAEYCEAHQLTRCELVLTHECMGEAHAPAHRHARVWYRSTPEKLYDPKQWIPACQSCHFILDTQLSRAESDAIFNRLRGVE